MAEQIIYTVNDTQEIVSLFLGAASIGEGTVTSVGISGANGIEVADSPITSFGTIALSLNKTNTLSFLNVADGATANSTDAFLLARANHTGTQLAATISDFENQVKAVSLFPTGLALSDETTDLAIGQAISFQMPNFATTLTGVSVNVVTAPTGSALTFDLNEGGVSVLSTLITIDATEFTSETAAVPPVISDSAIAANAILSVDIDSVGSTIAGAGGKIWLYLNKA